MKLPKIFVLEKNIEDKIKQLLKRPEEAEEPKKQKSDEFYSIHNLKSLDTKIEAYLQEKGFRRMYSLSFFQDTLGHYKRYLRKNPTYISDSGYFFRIHKDIEDPTSHYTFGETRKAKNKHSLLSNITPRGDLGEYMTIGAVSFGTAGALIDGGLLASIGGGLGIALGAVCEIIRESLNKKNVNILSEGVYEPIKELIKIFGE